jgi:hypothetical protein
MILNVSLNAVLFAESYTKNINEAEEGIIDAYIQVYRAEESGAEVESLVKDLNKAIDILMDVKLNGGNSQEALFMLENCKSIYESVEADARALQTLTVQQTRREVESNYVISRIILIIVIFALIYGWTVFKKYYYNKVLDMKPVVS